MQIPVKIWNILEGILRAQGNWFMEKPIVENLVSDTFKGQGPVTK